MSPCQYCVNGKTPKHKIFTEGTVSLYPTSLTQVMIMHDAHKLNMSIFLPSAKETWINGSMDQLGYHDQPLCSTKSKMETKRDYIH